jgi:hypothetical protein
MLEAMVQATWTIIDLALHHILLPLALETAGIPSWPCRKDFESLSQDILERPCQKRNTDRKSILRRAAYCGRVSITNTQPVISDADI